MDGFVKTRPLSLWLGDGQNAVARLTYELGPTRKSFELEILSSNKAVAGTLKIDTAGMANQSVTAAINGQCVQTFAGGGIYACDGFKNGDHLLLLTLAGNDCNGNGVVDLCDIATGGSWDVNGNGLPDECERPQADIDQDGDVDTDDVALLNQCLNGPMIPSPESCRGMDLDGDGDVDLSDFGILQGCLSGEGVPVNPDCEAPAD